MHSSTDRDDFLRDVLRNRCVRAIFDRWDRLALPDGCLVAGCLFQTVWNCRSGAQPETDIKDYDFFYFDASDLGEDEERRVQGRVDDVLADLGIVAEAKNQARVHLWYEAHFGYPYPQLASACEGIDRFLIPATCVGLRPSSSGWELYAPNGLSLLYQGILTPNPLTDHRPLFKAKAAAYQSRWPWLSIVEGT